MLRAKLGEPAGLGGRAGAQIGSAAAIFPVAIFLAALALFFAGRAQASSGERDAHSPAGEIAQAAQRLAGTPAASGGVADTGGTSAEPVVAASGLGAASAPSAVAVLRPSAHRAPAATLPGAPAHTFVVRQGASVVLNLEPGATVEAAGLERFTVQERAKGNEVRAIGNGMWLVAPAAAEGTRP